jgi:hypothetical protein
VNSNSNGRCSVHTKVFVTVNSPVSFETSAPPPRYAPPVAANDGVANHVLVLASGQHRSAYKKCGFLLA